MTAMSRTIAVVEEYDTVDFFGGSRRSCYRRAPSRHVQRRGCAGDRAADPAAVAGGENECRPWAKSGSGGYYFSSPRHAPRDRTCHSDCDHSDAAVAAAAVVVPSIPRSSK